MKKRSNVMLDHYTLIKTITKYTMKPRLNINLFRVSPCGKYISIHKRNKTEEVNQWQLEHNLASFKDEAYINYILTEEVNVCDLFESYSWPRFIDGFSPNLNKELHIGHLSNFVIGKAFTHLYSADSIYTLNSVSGCTEEYKTKIFTLMDEFDYYRSYELNSEENVKDYLANNSLLIAGSDKYANTEIIDLNGQKRVCIKSDGSSTYLMEDIANLHYLNNDFNLQDTSVWYITGKEQIQHFKDLATYSKEYIGKDLVHHIPCGLVYLGNSKMSTRIGKVVLAEDLIQEIAMMFNGDRKLAYNIIAGQILSSSTETDKVLDFDLLRNPKTSIGLYLSYTIARLQSAGININTHWRFSPITFFVFIQAQTNKSIHNLLKHMRTLAERINKDYEDRAKFDISSGDSKVIEHFSTLGGELLLLMSYLGLYDIKKV